VYRVAPRARHYQPSPRLSPISSPTTAPPATARADRNDAIARGTIEGIVTLRCVARGARIVRHQIDHVGIDRADSSVDVENENEHPWKRTSCLEKG